MHIEIASWMMVALSLIGNLLVIRKRIGGFYCWAFANIGWVALDIHARQYAQAVLFATYLGLTVWGIWEWRQGR